MIASLAEWDDLEAAHPSPTFFGKPAFARALHDAYPRLQPAPLALYEGGKRYIVPLMQSWNVLGQRSGVGLPLGAYTCVRDARGRHVNEPLLSSLLVQAAETFDRLEVTCWPLAEQPSLRGWERTPYQTAVIDCAGGRDASLSAMRGVTRRMAGQATRRGVDCVLSNSDPSALRSYYEILQASSREWGYAAPTISFELLRSVFAHGEHDAELWFVMADGAIAAGGVALFGSDELFFWSAAMRREYSRWRPSNALNVRLIERACERGVRWYNLGASEGLAGVERFKHDLGARDVGYARVGYRSRPAALYAGVRTFLRRVQVHHDGIS